MEMIQAIKQAHETYANHIEERLNTTDPFLNFKRDPVVNDMLEHVSFEQGVKYKKALSFNPIYTRFTGLLQILLASAQENDSIGNPITYPYEFMVCEEPINLSPTSLRYMFYAVQLINKIYFIDKHPKETALRIAEVGGGYGGFCKILISGLKHIGYSIETYDHFETKSSHRFLFAYLNHFDFGDTVITSTTMDSLENTHHYHYFVSFFSFSELTTQDRETYLHNLIKYCDHGYIAWNFLPDNDIRTIENVILKPVEIVDERVFTGGGNKTVTW